MTGEQRIDNDIQLDNSTVFPFAVLDNAGKLPDDFPDCSTGCEEFFILKKMGVNTAWWGDGVMTSDSDKKMGETYGESFQINVPIVDYRTEAL